MLAHEEAFARNAICKSLRLCFESENPKFWNKVIYDIGMGTMLSLVFYLLLVKLPETLKRQRIKRGLMRQYRSFKLGCLAVILLVVDNSYTTENLERLLDKSAFRQNFQRDPVTKLSRWDTFLNNVSDDYVGEILTHIQLLREEISYVLNNIEIDRDDVFEFLKQLGMQTYWLKDSSSDYDGIKRLSGFLWSTLSGWNFIDGYEQPDVVDAMIAEI